MLCRTCICISVLHKLILVLLEDQNFRHFPNETELFARCSLLSVRCSLLFARCSLLFASCSLIYSRCWLLSVRCSLLFARCSLLVTFCLLLVTFCPAFMGNCPTIVTHVTLIYLIDEFSVFSSLVLLKEMRTRGEFKISSCCFCVSCKSSLHAL